MQPRETASSCSCTASSRGGQEWSLLFSSCGAQRWARSWWPTPSHWGFRGCLRTVPEGHHCAASLPFWEELLPTQVPEGRAVLRCPTGQLPAGLCWQKGTSVAVTCARPRTRSPKGSAARTAVALRPLPVEPQGREGPRLFALPSRWPVGTQSASLPCADQPRAGLGHQRHNEVASRIFRLLTQRERERGLGGAFSRAAALTASNSATGLAQHWAGGLPPARHARGRCPPCSPQPPLRGLGPPHPIMRLSLLRDNKGCLPALFLHRVFCLFYEEEIYKTCSPLYKERGFLPKRSGTQERILPGDG